MLIVRFALLAALLILSLTGRARAAQALDDSQLAQISGGDGIGIVMHLALNDPSLADAVTDSRLSIGFNAGGTNTYLVIRNLRGIIDMAGTTLDVRQQAGGGDYLAIGLPAQLKFSNFGFDSLSAQADPLAPVTGDLGRFNLNGSMALQGELRMWAH